MACDNEGNSLHNTLSISTCVSQRLSTSILTGCSVAVTLASEPFPSKGGQGWLGCEQLSQVVQGDGNNPVSHLPTTLITNLL